MNSTEEDMKEPSPVKVVHALDESDLSTKSDDRDMRSGKIIGNEGVWDVDDTDSKSESSIAGMSLFVIEDLRELTTRYA